MGSVVSAQHVKDSVFNLYCALNAIFSYVQAWQIAVNQLSQTSWDFTAYEKIQKFTDGIPDHQAFTFLQEEIHQSWNNNSEGLFDFFTLANTILETNIDVCHQL